MFDLKKFLTESRKINDVMSEKDRQLAFKLWNLPNNLHQIQTGVEHLAGRGQKGDTQLMLKFLDDGEKVIKQMRALVKQMSM